MYPRKRSEGYQVTLGAVPLLSDRRRHDVRMRSQLTRIREAKLTEGRMDAATAADSLIPRYPLLPTTGKGLDYMHSTRLGPKNQPWGRQLPLLKGHNIRVIYSSCHIPLCATLFKSGKQRSAPPRHNSDRKFYCMLEPTLSSRCS